MSGRRNHAQHADYGIDARGAVRKAVIVGLTCGLLGAISYAMLEPRRRPIARRALALETSVGLLSLILVGSMLWSSRAGKLRARDRLIGAIPWRGDEVLLDGGCGSGLFLIGAAKRLTVGRAVRVDIWSASDQSGNTPGATLKKARIEGVAERVEVMDGDARRLPFEDGTFDVVLSSLVLHNIHAAFGREEALREVVRVLKQGHLAILDVLHTGQYTRVLGEARGLSGVERTGPRFLFFYSRVSYSARRLFQEPRRIASLIHERRGRGVLGNSHETGLSEVVLGHWCRCKCVASALCLFKVRVDQIFNTPKFIGASSLPNTL